MAAAHRLVWPYSFRIALPSLPASLAGAALVCLSLAPPATCCWLFLAPAPVLAVPLYTDGSITPAIAAGLAVVESFLAVGLLRGLDRHSPYSQRS